jgi:hypothetical protein
VGKFSPERGLQLQIPKSGQPLNGQKGTRKILTRDFTFWSLFFNEVKRSSLKELR